MQSLQEINATRGEYQLKTFQKLLYLALAAVFLCGGGFFLKLASDPAGREFAMVVGLLFLVPGFILVSLALRSRLILDGDRIELRSALRTFTANRNEIDGLRAIENQYGRWTRIYLKDGRDAFNVSSSFSGNDELVEWLKGVPDLDQQDAAQIMQQIGDQDRLGASDYERFNALKQAKAWMIGLSVVAGVASVSAMVNYPKLHALSMALLALLPPVGIYLVCRFPLLFTIFKRKPDPRIEMGAVVFWPGIGMMLSYQLGSDPSHLVDATQLMLWVILVLLCFVVALFRIAWVNPSRGGALFGLLLLGGMYSVGLVNAANTVPDVSAPRVYHTWVVKMHETHGKNATSYLTLAPWGPIVWSDDVSVPPSTYRQTKVGDPICVGLRPGFLHAPWYTLIPCSNELDHPSHR